MRQVRREYEETVEQLEGDLLGDGRVTWSHPHHLCLPQHDYSIEERQDFSYPPHEDRSITHDEDSRRMGDKDEAEEEQVEHHEKVEPEQVEHYKKVEEDSEVAESTDDHSSRGNVSQLTADDDTILEPPIRTTFDPCQIAIPHDKKELLKLRSQLAMELVWVKQAISSRQQVMYKHSVMCLQIISIVQAYNMQCQL